MLEEQSKPKTAIYLIVGFVILIIIAAVLFITFRSRSTEISGQSNQPLPEITPSKLRILANLGFDQKSEVENDPYNDKNGPYYHKVYKATSTDGITFTATGELIADKSSVPDVVKFQDKIFIYAVDGAKRNAQGLMVSVSQDSGKTWKQGSFDIQPTSNEPFVPADPQAVLLDDGRIRLFFVAFPAKKPPLDATGKPLPTGESFKIKSAISTDGLNFKEETGTRYESTDILTDPDVINIQGKWFMYLAKGSEQIATSSTDGLLFKLEKTVRQQGAISKTVKTDDGKYRQFYCKNGISSSVTTDGLNFSDEKVALTDSPGQILCDPSPIKVGNEWLMFYKAALITVK